jgi:protoheme IX farnesyltransferase
MERTKSRPFVTGVVTHNKNWLWIIATLLLASVGMACWVFNLAVGFHVFMGAFTYGVVYTLWLKRTTTWNIVIGGAAGSFAVLAGSAAADPGLSASSIILAVVLFLWTPPHFWALAIAIHEDYKAAGVPMLPVVVGDDKAAKIILANIVVLVAVSLLPGLYGMGWLYMTGATLGGLFFIYKGIQLAQNANPKTAIRCFVASLVQLTLLLITAMIDPLIMS